MNGSNQSFRDLTVYRKAFELAMQIFEISKTFPKEERYSLTDQIRRSSRSVCACLVEAHKKRLYEAYYISKISDADMENAETQTWLAFASACQYITEKEYNDLLNLSEEVGRLLHHMITNPEKYK